MSRLVVFAGPPCSGKSATARLLGWPHLEMDEARASILPAAAHTREDRAVAYRAVLWTAAHILRLGQTVIVDGGFGHAEDRIGCQRVAGGQLYVVEFRVGLNVALERNRARMGHHPGLDLTDDRVAEIVGSYPWSNAGLTVDGSWPLSECANAVRCYLEAGQPVAPGGYTAGLAYL